MVGWREEVHGSAKERRRKNKIDKKTYVCVRERELREQASKRKRKRKRKHY